MIERFEGDTNRKNLIEALKKQSIIRDDEILANNIADFIELIEFNKDDNIIVEGEADNDLYFIFSGRVSILINGREVAIRGVGDHVGEMALIDVSAVRSASVAAIEKTVVGKITESDFTNIADKNPRLWRLIALNLGDRLRQRKLLVNEKNARPVVFIGSSCESLPIGREIQSCFQYDNFVVRLWTDNVFQASDFPIESLTSQVESSDFAILVLSPDDKVISRGEEKNSPRDNLIFELGLFMGSLTRQRTFIIIPRNLDVKIPSDLLGLTVLKYNQGKEEDLNSRIAPICNELRKIFKEKGSK